MGISPSVCSRRLVTSLKAPSSLPTMPLEILGVWQIITTKRCDLGILRGSFFHFGDILKQWLQYNGCRSIETPPSLPTTPLGILKVWQVITAKQFDLDFFHGILFSHGDISEHLLQNNICRSIESPPSLPIIPLGISKVWQTIPAKRCDLGFLPWNVFSYGGYLGAFVAR